MSNQHFAAMPNISVPRSRFKQPFNHATSFNHGEIVPIDCFEVIPGDGFKLDLSALVWMSTPIAPLFGNIKLYLKAFFVPMRLVWNHTEEFYGANKTSAGYQTGTYTIPRRSIFTDGINDRSLSSYLGKPVITKDTSKSGYGLVSILKERGYYTIYNEHYRAEQVQNPVIVNITDTGAIGTLGGTTLDLSSGLLVGNKEFDYFTAATLFPQYGSAITLPLGTYAPVVTRDPQIPVYTNDHPHVYPINFGGSINNTAGAGYRTLVFSQATGNAVSSNLMPSTTVSAYTGDTGSNVAPYNLWADLSNATAASINTLRYAFAVQKYLERANFGSRFYEILNVHYGVTSPDSRLQIPERLGSAVMDININTVLSTAGYAAGSSTEVGAPGAVSCSAKGHMSLFTKDFVEPGYVFVLACTHHERSYNQGILREDSKYERFEFYSPEFANLGDQEILNKEIYLQGTSQDNQVFGYQEHWAEYRYRPDRVSGKLNPQASSPLPYWTLVEDFSALPQLSSTFLKENRDLLARCLVTGSTGPDYIADFYFDYTATREMPLFTIPGLIDHFGTM